MEKLPDRYGHYPPYPADLDRAIDGVSERRHAVGEQLAELNAEWEYLFALEIDFKVEKSRRNYGKETSQ